ncbi:MAG: hypoxanthine phosphoribosyltransferase [Acutalibacteraceae bacterium]|nr:hypoxanthine phosphoribosyltransferase [Bacillota bacterium]
MKNEMDQDIQKILYNEREIKGIMKKLGGEVSRDYAGKNPLLVAVLKGSVVVLADFMRNLSINCEIDFMIVSSYAGTKSKGSITIIQDLRTDICDRDVIIVEDIIDSGITLNSLVELLKQRNPRSLKICTFLDKPSGRQSEISADYVGGTVGNEFIVGYGLDYNEKYRNLPYIGVLKESVYSHN